MAYALRNLNIMLVEDDPTMRALIRDVLDAFGVGVVRTANDGARAFDLLRSFAADIVILDWCMAPVDGLEFLRRIRNAPDTPNPFVPAIMLTAFTELDRVLESRDAGVTEFLAKPVTPAKLYGRIVSVIEDRRVFVRSDSFFGPDRRRMARPFPGMDRRGGDSVIHIDAPDAAGIREWRL